jgi:hypothetical protein
MAKTTSEIVKENKEREKIAQQIADAMNARDERDAQHKTTDELVKENYKRLQQDQSQATETVEIVAVEPVQESYLLPAVSGAAGFILGAVLMAVYFKLKIKRIQKDCETRISEARTTLDRVLEMATK